jgi:hypothetical protein
MPVPELRTKAICALRALGESVSVNQQPYEIESGRCPYAPAPADEVLDLSSSPAASNEGLIFREKIL